MGIQQILMTSGAGLSTPNIFAEYVVVAGGGGAGGGLSGGGGAGGFRTGLFEYTVGIPYPISVGNGGGIAIGPYASGTTSYELVVYGLKGSDSNFGPIVSAGGGGGGGYWNTNPDPTQHDGGSGGGQGYYGITRAGNVPPTTPPQGNPGGTGGGYGGGGGGGAGAGGGNAPPDYTPSGTAGSGGIGAPVTWPELPASYGTPGPSPGRWFAGGGGGGGGQGRNNPGSGGIGGGGPATYTNGTPGTTNTGGGGGASYWGFAGNGGSGGPGIVMIRIPIGISHSALGTVSNFTSPTHRVLVYTGPGSITFNN